MSFVARLIRRASLASAFGLCVAAPAVATDWPPIAAAELALAKPNVDPTADAEALFWDVRLTDQTDGSSFATVFEHHLRIKVFTDRGRESQSTIELPYTGSVRVREVEGRTIAPDGTVTELRAQDVFDRTIVRASGLKVKAKSFVLPNVVPGAIIEYRWREVRDDSLAMNLELELQREIPVHTVRYHVKPLGLLATVGYRMRLQSFNTGQLTLVSEPHGYSLLEAKNIPAFSREPFSPPDLAVKAWVLVYYVNADKGDPPVEKFWGDYSKQTVDEFRPLWRVTNDIKVAAARASSAGTSVAETIGALVKDVRARVTRNDTDTAPEAIARDRKERKNAADTLKRGAGNGPEMNLLFAAMASAANLETRLALLPDRSHMGTDPAMKQPYLLSHLAVAIKEGDGWRFVDPANEHAAGGHLAWEHEGMPALLLDAKAPRFVPVPDATPEFSAQKRTGTVRLLETGAIEGTLALEYTGHFAVQLRERDDDSTAEERRQVFAERMSRRWPGFELIHHAVTNLENPELPYVVTITFRVPNYGQRVGSRLLVQPAIFQHQAEAVFPATSRRAMVEFPHAWVEEDAIAIETPPGYRMETQSVPEPFLLNKGVAARYEMGLSDDGTRVQYRRRFMVGGGGQVMFPKESYPVVKAWFDGVQRLDAHTVALRRTSD